MHISWPPRCARILPADAATGAGDLSGDVLEIVSHAMVRAGPTDHSKASKVPHAQLILHQQPLTTRAIAIALA